MGEDFDRLQEIAGVKSLFSGNAGCRPDQRTQEILHLHPADSSDVESVLQRMIDEQNTRRSGYGVVQKSNLILLVSMLGRLWDNQFEGGAYSFNEKRNQLAEALHHIDRHFDDELSVMQLASIVYMSPDHFRKLFKETTGMSTVKYINKVRISKSIRLLENRSLSIGRVAELVGIADVNYFTRLFHANLGYTPSEYRRKTGIC
jgi:AraC family L-rhamnose operon transcriptional activator RhaR/AraC family L-rhamnose operon regulatory protein RhaS